MKQKALAVGLSPKTKYYLVNYIVNFLHIDVDDKENFSDIFSEKEKYHLLIIPIGYMEIINPAYFKIPTLFVCEKNEYHTNIKEQNRSVINIEPFRTEIICDTITKLLTPI